MNNAGAIWGTILLGWVVLVCTLLYIVPIVIAVARELDNVKQIVAVNLLAGWIFGVGWIVAFVWALKPKRYDPFAPQPGHNMGWALHDGTKR